MDLPELFKVKKKRYTDADGKRCKKSDRGAVEKTDVSADWYANVPVIESTAERIQRRQLNRPAPSPKRVRLCQDKRAAREMLRKLILSAERNAAGIIDYQTQGIQRTAELIDSFRDYLTAGQNSPEYVDLKIGRIEAVVNGCQFLRIADLDSDAAALWLYRQREKPPARREVIRGKAKTYQEIADAFGVSVRRVTYWRKEGAPIIGRKVNDLAKISNWLIERESRSMSAATSNHYVTALRSFGKWLSTGKGRRVEANPFDDLAKIDGNTDIRKVRRVLDREGFARLIHAAENNPRTFRGLTGADRAMIYTTASYTGLRAGELASLTTASFDLDGQTPSVNVKSSYTKNKKFASIPLRSDLVGRLRSYLATLQPATLSIKRTPVTVWPGTWSDDGVDMIRLDLKAAGIEYRDDDGKDYDFHALRHQFITDLSKAGVSLRVAQELARHSTPELTANIYTHLSVHDTAAGIERLEAIPKESKPAKGTGA